MLLCLRRLFTKCLRGASVGTPSNDFASAVQLHARIQRCGWALCWLLLGACRSFCSHLSFLLLGVFLFVCHSQRQMWCRLQPCLRRFACSHLHKFIVHTRVPNPCGVSACRGAIARRGFGGAMAASPEEVAQQQGSAEVGAEAPPELCERLGRIRDSKPLFGLLTSVDLTMVMGSHRQRGPKQVALRRHRWQSLSDISALLRWVRQGDALCDIDGLEDGAAFDHPARPTAVRAESEGCMMSVGRTEIQSQLGSRRRPLTAERSRHGCHAPLCDGAAFVLF